jgi:hypothetical protein
MPSGLVEYVGEGSGGGVLAGKDGCYWVPDLEEELQFTPPSHIVNGDEKP